MKNGFTLINFLRKTTKANPSGFTLIELLVVITIIAILGGITLLTYNQSLVNSRDARRKTDLQAIVNALEIYYQKTGHYPCATSPVLSSQANPWIKDSCNAFAPLDSSYIDNMPKDPKQDLGDPVTSATNIFGYSYWTPPFCLANVGQYYVLAAGLENVNDGDADAQKNYQYCGGDLIARSGSNVMVIVPQ